MPFIAPRRAAGIWSWRRERCASVTMQLILLRETSVRRQLIDDARQHVRQLRKKILLRQSGLLR